METDEKRRAKEAAALSGGHLCHVCGYQYPNPHPSAKLRRSHRKHCGKAAAPAAAVVVEEEGEVEGLRVSELEERNAREDGKGGGVEGKAEANGGAALLGSAGEVGKSVDKAIAAEQSSSNVIGVHQVTLELNENGQINDVSSESVSPSDKVINGEFNRSGLIDCSSKSEHVTENDCAELPIGCTSGSRDEVAEHCPELSPNAVTNPAEREDSFDEYQDASPFLHQSDSEDGAVPSSEFYTKINNVKTVLSSVATNEISLGTNVLCKDQESGELSLNNLSAGSKVDDDSGNGTLSLVGPEANPKLGAPYESNVNVGSNHTDMIDNKHDKGFYHSELIGDPDALPLPEPHSVILDTDSGATCSRKMQGHNQDTSALGTGVENTQIKDATAEVTAVHSSEGSELHNRYDASARPEAAESSNVQLETIIDSSTNTMPVGDGLKLVQSEHNPTNISTELSTQNWPVKDTSDVQLPVENLCKENLGSKAGFQNNLSPATNVDDTLYSITKDSCSDLGFTFEARTRPDIVEQHNVVKESSSVQKTSESTEVCNKQIDPEVPIEDQFPKTQKHDVLPMDQTSCVKHTFDLDDARNDDLFELPTNSCYLEVSADVSKQQVDSASLTVDQLTVSNRTRMADMHHNHNSNECILSASSFGEIGHPVGPKDTPDTSSAELVTNTRLADAHLQENDPHTNGIPIVHVPYQVAPMELRTVCSQDTSALGTGVENMQIKDATAEETAVHSSEGSELKQADDTTAMDTHAINVEAKVTQDTAAKMNEMQLCNVEKNADSIKAVQSMSNLEDTKPTEGTTAKEMNAQAYADILEGKQQTDGTSAEKKNDIGCADNFEDNTCIQATSTKEMIAAQITVKVDGNKQTNSIADQEGNIQKEEIAVTGGRLNSARIHVPLKVLLAEASAENKVTKPSAKERVLSFRRRVSKNDNSSAKSGSPKSGSNDHRWDSPAKLPRKDTDKSSKGGRQPWMPFICCHTVR